MPEPETGSHVVAWTGLHDPIREPAAHGERALATVQMSGLTAFGLFAVTAMLVCYALETRSHWFVLGFAAACALGSVYGFLQGAWPFGIVESIWSVVALRRWLMRRPVPT